MTNQENNIYEKLANVQMELAKVEFKKSGHNKFGGFDYFELDDIMPCIMQKCIENNLLMQFDFTETSASLILIDMQNPEYKITNHVPMPEIVEMNKKMNIVQSLGAYVTYLKRYLLLNTFCICEKSVIDSDALSEINAELKKQKAPAKSNRPKRPERKQDNHSDHIKAMARKRQANENPVFMME